MIKEIIIIALLINGEFMVNKENKILLFKTRLIISIKSLSSLYIKPTLFLIINLSNSPSRDESKGNSFAKYSIGLLGIDTR